MSSIEIRSAKANRQQKFEEVLASFSGRLKNRQGVGAILDLVSDTIAQVVDVDACVVALPTKQGNGLQNYFLSGPRPTAMPSRPGSARLDVMLSATHGGAAITEFKQDHSKTDQRIWGQGRLAAPFTAAGTTTGAIGLGRESTAFSHDEVEFVTQIARLTAPRIAGCLADERLTRAVFSLENARAEFEKSAVDYRKLFEYHPAMLFMIDRNGQIVMVNQAVCDALDHAEIDLVGTVFSSLIVGSRRDEVARHLEVAWSESANTSFEALINRKAASPINVRITARCVAGSTGDSSMLLAVDDVTESVQLQKQLRYAAEHDLMTGLANRERFQSHLAKQLSSLAMSDEPTCLLAIDIDHFKEVNDTEGHAAGDELLTRLAQALRSSVRAADIVGRVGGDEFAVLLDDCDVENAIRISETICRRVENMHFSWGESEFKITLSIGVAALDAHDTCETAMAAADGACYAAKRAGRNCVRTAGVENLGQFSHTRALDVAREIQGFIDHNKLRIYSQPIVSLSQGRSQRAREVLLRCVTGTQVLAPDRIMPADDRVGVTTKVDKWVVAQSLAWLRDNPDERVVINLWPKSIADPDFVPELVESIVADGVSPELITFEFSPVCITETTSRVLVLCNELGSLGCRFGIDDATADLEIFRLLTRLPVDYLKLDTSLTERLATDPLARTTIVALALVAHESGLEIGAKRVESEADAKTLEDCGVNFIQGRLTGPPVPL